MYATLDDLYLIYGETNVKQLLFNPSDTSTLLRSLKNASSEIDGYIGQKYHVPLKYVPPLINECTCVIAFYKRSLEYGAGLSEERRKRYDDIVRYLKDVASGKAVIPELINNIEGDILKPEAKLKIIVNDSNPKRIFTRRTMDGL